MASGVALSIALHLHKTSRPHVAEVGRVPGTEHFRNVLRHQVETDPRILTLRIDESLYFVNARFLEDLVQARVTEGGTIRHVVLMFSAVNEVDYSALESLEAINRRLGDMGVGLHLIRGEGTGDGSAGAIAHPGAPQRPGFPEPARRMGGACEATPCRSGMKGGPMTMKISESAGPGSPRVAGFYEPDSGSIQYVAACPATGKAALIDVVQRFDPAAAATGMEPAREVLDWVRSEGLEVEWVLDTHPHADHLMASAWLKERTGAPNAIGEKVREIAGLWRDYYHMPDLDPEPQFDRLWADGDTFALGELNVRVMLSPGHTLGSVTYVIGDAAFVHDTFMQPDAGTARADFPGGSAAVLYDSLQAILSLPDDTRLFVGHDYGTEARDEPAWESTVAEQKASNLHVGGGTSKADYVRIREGRDATLSLPDRILAALQVNLRGGRLPEPEDDGHRYLKVPLNRF